MKNITTLLLIFLFSNILSSQTRVFPFKENNKWGVIDENQKIIKEPFFDYIHFFDFHDSENAVSYVMQSLRKGLIDRNGKIIIPTEYDQIYVSKSLKTARLSNKRMVGIFNLKKKKIGIPLIYDLIITHEDEKYFSIKNLNEYGISDINHKIIVPIKYESVEVLRLKNGIVNFKALLNNSFTFFDHNGKVIRKIVKEKNPPDEYIGTAFLDADFSDNENFNTIPPIKLNSNKLGNDVKLSRTIKNTKNGERLGIIQKGWHYGIIDEECNLLAPIQYQEIKLDYLLPGLLLKGKNGFYGWFSIEKKKVMLSTDYQKIEKADRFSAFHIHDKKLDNYFIIYSSDHNLTGFFDKNTGQIFLPKK